MQHKEDPVVEGKNWEGRGAKKRKRNLKKALAISGMELDQTFKTWVGI
jgi:hypothetical protein